MSTNGESIHLLEQYAAAHAAHYGTKNLREALERYKAIMAAHPNSRESGYSRAQIRNIVTSVVQEQQVADAEVELALTHLDPGATGCEVSPPIAQAAAGALRPRVAAGDRFTVAEVGVGRTP